jgi:predicted NUDIX family phosphoesterase
MVDREKLKVKYGDEQVLVVPLAVVQKLGLDDCLYSKYDTINMDVLTLKLENESYYIPRYKSDENPEEVELIPYITFKDGNAIFMYKRIKNGDSRGDGKFSIGVGGHINPIDSEVNQCPIYNGAVREISEELGLELPVIALEPKGFIRSHSGAFNNDHLGIHIEVSTSVYDVAEKDKMLPVGMIAEVALPLFEARMEDWTKIIISNKER